MRPALDGERATVLGGVQGKLASLVALRATLDPACAPCREDSYEGRDLLPLAAGPG